MWTRPAGFLQCFSMTRCRLGVCLGGWAWAPPPQAEPHAALQPVAHRGPALWRGNTPIEGALKEPHSHLWGIPR